MKGMRNGILVIVLVTAILLAAGCTMSKSASTGTTSGQQAAAGSASAGSAASSSAGSAGGSCPAVTAATSWTGKWDSQPANNICFDLRKAFYPKTDDNPDPWNNAGGEASFPVTFTQTGCDVTGSVTISSHSGSFPDGCPVTFKGTVDNTGTLAGTWKSYCGMSFGLTHHADVSNVESGIFHLNMEPGGSTFTGIFSADTPDVTDEIKNNCPNADSNWVGKRA